MLYGVIYYVVKDINIFFKLMNEKLFLYIYRCIKCKNVYFNIIVMKIVMENRNKIDFYIMYFLFYCLNMVFF